MSRVAWLIAAILFVLIPATIVAWVAAVSWYREALRWRAKWLAICEQDRTMTARRPWFGRQP